MADRTEDQDCGCRGVAAARTRARGEGLLLGSVIPATGTATSPAQQAADLTRARRRTRIDQSVPCLPPGTRVTPQGETTLRIRVDAARLRAGLPAIRIESGVDFQTAQYARAVQILGPACLIPSTVGLPLVTSAAVEVLL